MENEEKPKNADMKQVLEVAENVLRRIPPDYAKIISDCLNLAYSYGKIEGTQETINAVKKGLEKNENK